MRIYVTMSKPHGWWMRDAVLFGCLATAAACASVTTRGVVVRDSIGDASPVAPPARSGAPRRVLIHQLKVPRDIAEQYTELADKRIGWGLANRLLEALYDIGRFEFIEEKSSVLARVSEQW